MKNINIPLSIGAVIAIILGMMAFFPHWFSDQDPNTQQPRIQLEEKEVEGEVVRIYHRAPHAPNPNAWLGTDGVGRDLWTRLVYGTNTTLKAVVLTVVFRFFVAIPIGVLAGMRFAGFSKGLRIFNTLFTTIPSLIFSFIILNIEYIKNLPLNQAMPIFVAVLTIVGWPKLATQIEERTQKIMEEDFIEGEVALGKHQGQILKENVLPHLTPSLISWGFVEMGLVLFLLAQLSILGIFIGPSQGAMVIDGAPQWFTAVNAEWSNLLSRAPIDIRAGHYWLGFFPSLFFFIGITGFNLIGEGLKEEFSKRDSRIVSWIQQGIYQLSPMLYVKQIKKFNKYPVPIVVKTTLVILLTGFIIYPGASSLYYFDGEQSWQHLENLTELEAGHRGVQNYILENMERAGLVKPSADSYIFTTEENNQAETLIGIIPGKNWEKIMDPDYRGKKERLVIIGARYDGIYQGKSLISPTRATGAANALTLAHTLQEMNGGLGPTVMFIFWDGKGSEVNIQQPNLYMRRPVVPRSRVNYTYIDLGYIPQDTQRSLQISLYTSKAQQIQFQQLMYDLQNTLDHNQIRYHLTMNLRGSGAIAGLSLNSMFSIGVGEEYYSFMEQESLELEGIHRTFLEQQGQFILDMITMTDHFE